MTAPNTPALPSASTELAVIRDANSIKQPGWHHVAHAFIEGAREARANADAGDADFKRAADGYTKRVFEEVDPESERRLRTGDWEWSEIETLEVVAWLYYEGEAEAFPKPGQDVWRSILLSLSRHDAYKNETPLCRLSDAQAEIQALRADARPVAAVLTVDVKGRPGVQGMTVGADGSGQFAYIIRGTQEQADKWARDHIRQREKAGQRFLSCVLVFNEEGWGGPLLTTIDAAISANGEGGQS